jgi:hypothetical protein
MNYFNISQANPLKFYKQADVFNTIANTDLNTFNPQFNKRNFDDDFYYRNIDRWVESRLYYQQFQQSDIIKLQWGGTDLLSPSGQSPYKINILDCNGIIIKQVTGSILYPTVPVLYNGDYLWEVSINLFDVPEGRYVVQIKRDDNLSGVPDSCVISEPIEIKTLHRDSKLFNYNNTSNANDIYYETGIQFQFRIDASFTELTTDSKFNVYEDQPMNLELLGGVKFRQWTLEFRNIPLWVCDKLELLFLHDQLKIDGIFYTRIDGSKIAITKNDGNSLCSAKIEVREKINKISLEISSVYTKRFHINNNTYILSNSRAFYVESLTYGTNTINIDKYFLGHTEFLNYLNSTIAHNALANNTDYCFFAVNDLGELILNTNIAFFNSLSIFKLNHLIDTFIEVDVENTAGNIFEIEIARSVANARYAVFSNDGTALHKGVSTGFFFSFSGNILVTTTTIFVFITQMDEINLDNSTIDIVGIGGNFHQSTYYLYVTYRYLRYFKNNFLLNTNSFNQIYVEGNSLPTSEIIKLLSYLWEVKSLGTGGTFATINQTPIAPLGNDIGVNTFINKLINLGWSITTD